MASLGYGCDASVLLDGPNSEKEGIPNKNSLRGFEVVDDAKAQLEAACPVIVSCADILAFAACDSSYKVGKIYYDVQAGCRDGRVSIDSETLANLPSPFVGARELIQNFARKEKEGIPNKNSLRGFEVVDDAKAQLEAACPVIVSCADILAFAACDSSYKVGKIYYDVQAGCRDGRVSIDSETLSNLPSPFVGARELIQNFARKARDTPYKVGKIYYDVQVGRRDGRVFIDSETLANLPSPFVGARELIQKISRKGMSADEMATLSVAHSIEELTNGIGVANPANLDVLTPNKLDNIYYLALKSQKGLLISDQTLMAHPTTAKMVNYNVRYGSVWAKKYAAAMIHMGTLDVLTGRKGEIRMNCHFVN
ncbi:hypothetical protein K7X08_003221 [Anisodus acutangulus]|uniref:Peroxidase n=1 Tax=Anisodus acutangulus TaxID=402998 RepID=A0A9Q1RII6_9SOLA|nr:hypothetical protein K7X08_003221 [Anisodus acutangulus]